MKFSHPSTGVRVVASFAILLLVMACISGVSLWRLQTANDTTMASRMAVSGALTLYLDFLNLFLFILSIMGDRRR